MTNKPMLSVERDLLQAHLNADSIEQLRNTERELRALLDKPACEHEFESPVLSSMPDFCKKCSEDKAAAQYQGEPVADDRLIEIARKAALNSTRRYSYMPAIQEDANSWLPHRWVVEAMRDAVFAAEQPAPVAVVMPNKINQGSLYPDASDCGWNDCIDEVARLNGVKP